MSNTLAIPLDLAENIAAYMEGSASPAAEQWHQELRALLAAELSNKCARCGASTVEGCNDLGCHFLESGNGAPVVERQPVAVVMATGGPHDREDRVLCELQAELPPVGTKLYAEQPAPVAVFLPDRFVHEHSGCFLTERQHGWNACLDKVKELNQ